MLCASCQTISISSLRECGKIIANNLSALKKSAGEGCGLCKFFLSQIYLSRIEKYKEDYDTPINDTAEVPDQVLSPIRLELSQSLANDHKEEVIRILQVPRPRTLSTLCLYTTSGITTHPSRTDCIEC